MTRIKWSVCFHVGGASEASRECKTDSPEFKADSPEFKTDSPEFKTDSPECKTDSPEFKTDSPEFKTDSPEFAEGVREEGRARGELAKHLQMTTVMVMRSSNEISRHSHGVYASGTPVLVACGLCSIEEKTRRQHRQMMATIHIPNGLRIEGERRGRRRGFSLEIGRHHRRGSGSRALLSHSRNEERGGYHGNMMHRVY
jgi:hypothetical protein